MKNEVKPSFQYGVYIWAMLTLSWMSWMLHEQKLDAGYWAGLFATYAAGTAVGYAWGKRDHRKANLEARARGFIEDFLQNDELGALQINARLCDNGVDYPMHETYPLLRSMENEGILTSREVPGGPARGWRPRRIYSAQGGTRTPDLWGDQPRRSTN